MPTENGQINFAEIPSPSGPTRPRDITIKDIAAELGVSKSTVSRALAGDFKNVRKETCKKIVETAERMGYRRNEMAVNLRAKSSRVIGVVVPEILTPFSMSFISEVQKVLRNEGYGVTFAFSDENPEIERANLEMLNRARVDGILISSCNIFANRDIYEQFVRLRIPLVFFDRTIPDLPVSCVRSNDYLKSFFMVEELIYKKRRRIVHLEGPRHIHNSIERKKGWREALEKFGISYDSKYSIPCGVGIEDGERAIHDALERGLEFDGVFCFTETQALGAKRALQKRGVTIPQQVAVCCMSGTALSTLVYPQLTAVEQQVDKMGRIAAELLLEKIADPNSPDKTIVIDSRIVKRGSTEGS